MDNIIEGNFLIAKFYGFNYPDMNNEVWKLSLDIHNYHDDWNKLMQVVEKIGKLYDGKNISMWSLKNANVVLFDLGIFATKELVWGAVTQFITWYNNTQNKTEK